MYFFLITRLTTLKPLDREAVPKYTLIVLATEDCISTPKYQKEIDSVSSLKVNINVNDVNDNPPKFVSKIFTGGITTEADFGVEFMHIKVFLKVYYHNSILDKMYLNRICIRCKD